MKKNQQYQRTLWEIDQKWGQGTVRPAAEVTRRPALSTGFEALDHGLAAGGLALSHITLLRGVPTSGATTCAYQVIASGQRTAGFAAYIDLTANFDPESAHHCGVTLPHVLLLRSLSLEQGLAISRDILLANAAMVLVIDLLGLVISPSITAWERLADAALRSDCATLVLIDRPYNALESIAHTYLSFERQHWLLDQERVVGYHTDVHILKDKPRIQTARVSLDILFAGMSA